MTWPLRITLATLALGACNPDAGANAQTPTPPPAAPISASIIGPVRLEYGHNLNPREQDPSGTLHLSVGFPF